MGSNIEPTMALGRMVRQPVVAERTTIVKAADGSPTATHRSPATSSGSPYTELATQGAARKRMTPRIAARPTETAMPTAIVPRSEASSSSARSMATKRVMAERMPPRAMVCRMRRRANAWM